MPSHGGLIDLHSHSLASDGQYAAEVVRAGVAEDPLADLEPAHGRADAHHLTGHVPTGHQRPQHGDAASSAPCAIL